MQYFFRKEMTMPPLSVLIKPASSACGMGCAYCFYKDIAANRAHPFMGMLSEELLEKTIQSAFGYAEGSCTFVFQGGEPTLAGLDFFKTAVSLEKKYAKSGVEVNNCLQTNGLLIDAPFAEFLRENNFLTGLSLDGPADIHNQNRLTDNGKDTFNRVMQTAQLLKKHGAAFNVLSVVTGQSARYAEKIYRFFAKQGFTFLQFIPCIPPLNNDSPLTLTPEKYGEFLIKIFDLWYADLERGHYVSIRHLDNWFSVLLGGQPESCGMTGRCSMQFVVEGDGGVYPCDFYVLDEWRLGTIGKESFFEIQNSPAAARFIEKSLPVPEDCRACRLFAVCRNGCRRERGADGKYRYCASVKAFFDAREAQIQDSIFLIRNMRTS